MATNTTNYNLTKPAENETADIGVINANMDIIDGEMKKNYDHSLKEGNPHNLPIDSVLSATSENPIQNKAVAEAMSKVGNTTTKRVKDITIPIASWTADLTFPDYPHKAGIPVDGITEDWNCISLTPDHTDRALDMLCPFAYTGDGSITIYINVVPDHDTVIESIIFSKGAE